MTRERCVEEILTALTEMGLLTPGPNLPAFRSWAVELLYRLQLHLAAPPLPKLDPISTE